MLLLVSQLGLAVDGNTECSSSLKSRANAYDASVQERERDRKVPKNGNGYRKVRRRRCALEGRASPRAVQPSAIGTTWYAHWPDPTNESLGIPRAPGAIKHIRIRPPFVWRIRQLDFERDRSCGSKFTLDFSYDFDALDRDKKSTV